MENEEDLLTRLKIYLSVCIAEKCVKISDMEDKNNNCDVGFISYLQGYRDSLNDTYYFLEEL